MATFTLREGHYVLKTQKAALVASIKRASPWSLPAALSSATSDFLLPPLTRSDPRVEDVEVPGEAARTNVSGLPQYGEESR